MDTILTAAAPGSRRDHRTLTEQRLTDASQRLAATSEELKQSQEARYEFERQAITLEAEVKHLRENSTYEELMKRIVALESRGHNG